MNYTVEQNKVIFSEDNFIYVIAFAGTGKTTTLRAYAEVRPEKKILYVAYNDSVVREARSKFPKNVTVLTSHSLAYRKLGFNYKHKLTGYIKPDMVRKSLLLPRNVSNIILSKKVLEGVDKYCQSSYVSIEDCYYLVEDIPCDKKTYLFMVKKIWEKMNNLNSTFPITHDFYLKKFELLSPKLDYDVILFDEAQDANSATKSLILKQRMYQDIKILFVGDNHQEIYSFRGSNNALRGGENNYYLTQSFRFGNNIASVGNKVISLFKNEEKEIKGNNYINDCVGVEYDCQTAYISRTNAMVVANAIIMTDKNKKIFFVGGLKSYNFSKIIDVDNLFRGDRKAIVDYSIKKYKTFEQFERSAKEEDNYEYIYLCKIVKTYSEKIRDAMKKLNYLVVQDINKADVILTTAHKSKGLEFHQVILSNDFAKFFNKDGTIKIDVKEEEVNVLYVALTRAIYSLIPNKELDKIIGF